MLSMGINWNMTTAVVWLLIEHLSNNDDDSSKRFFKKSDLILFQNSSHLILSFNLSNIGQVFWIWILKGYD